MAAFDHAVEMGYNYIESDVWLTTDGVLVLFHDPTLDESTDSTGHIENYSWDELRQVKVGGSHGIPRLVDLLDTHPDIRLNLEPKHDAAVEPLAALLESRQLVGQVCIGSFSDRRINQMRQLLGPELCTSPGPKGMMVTLLKMVTPSWVPRLDSPIPYGALQLPVSFKGIPVVTGWLVGRAHALGLQVHVWTVNEEAEMRRLLDLGVDVIMTDATELLQHVLVDYA